MWLLAAQSTMPTSSSKVHQTTGARNKKALFSIRPSKKIFRGWGGENKVKIENQNNFLKKCLKVRKRKGEIGEGGWATPPPPIHHLIARVLVLLIYLRLIWLPLDPADGREVAPNDSAGPSGVWEVEPWQPTASTSTENRAAVY